MHHGVTGEILEADLRKPAAAPDPVSDDRIDQQCQDKGKNYEGHIFDSLRHGTGYDRRRCSAEYKLEEELAPERNRTGQRIVIKRKVRVSENLEMRGSDKPAGSPEHQAPSQKNKAQRRNREDDKVL